MKHVGELLYEEMKKAGGMTQKELGDKVGIDRSMISRYINGHDEIPKDFLERAGEVLNSLKLKMLAKGTTTSTIIFDQVKLDFYVTLAKAKQEFEEAAEAIEEVLAFGHNIDSIEECDSQQLEKIRNMLDQINDANHACDMSDLVCHDLGADIEKRNERCLQKYYSRGYLSSMREIKNDPLARVR